MDTLIQRFKAIKLTDAEKHEICKYYERYHDNVIPQLKFSDFDEFRRTGNRITYETHYFNRRRRINGTFMMYTAFGTEYLDELCDLLWAVCDEFTWALPAHMQDSINDTIDLFAAETAMMMSEISYLLKNSLPKEIHKRITNEIHRRIFIPFENQTFSWEYAEHNWSAVCGGCIGMTYLYNNRTVPKRIISALKCYLSGIHDDGACLEGLGYWSYGFGYYMYFAMLLKERTGIDIINSLKIKKIAEFQSKMYLYKNIPVSCSDALRTVSPLKGLTGIIDEIFNIPPPTDKLTRNDDCDRWAHYIRSYLYKCKEPYSAYGEFVFPVSQWYIYKNKNYGFFIKGGNNDEPHNHNDIGSFIIAAADGQLICDIGCGEYRADYFNNSTRYNYLCNSSAGHNVPIIDDNYQCAGAEYRCTEFVCKNNQVKLSFGKAYEADIDVYRKISLYENKISLQDIFINTHNITERFVSLIMPKVYKNKMQIGTMTINRAGKITKETISAHDGTPLTVYLIDFEAHEKNFEVEFNL